MPRRNPKPQKSQKPELALDCTHKRRYPSQSEAEAVKNDQEALDDDLQLRVYRCPQCGGWHLTRQRA